MVPSLSNAGFRPPSESMVVSARTPSSFFTMTGSPLRWGTPTSTISSASLPEAIAAAARWFDFIAASSCCSREMPPAA